MKKFEVVKGSASSLIDINLRTSNIEDIGKKVTGKLESLEGVEHALHVGRDYEITLIIGDLYSYTEMVPKIESVIASIFRPTAFEITNTANINEFIMWMGSVTVVGYLLSLLV